MYCNNQDIYSLLIYLDKESKKIFVRYINVSHHDSEFSRVFSISYFLFVINLMEFS